VSGSGQAVSGYTKSNYGDSVAVKDNGLYDFGKQSFYGSSTPVPSTTTGYTIPSSSPQYESSNFDSIAQQVASIAGSGQASSDYAASDYAGSGLTQNSGSYNFGQQSFYGSTTPVPSTTAGYTASSSSPQYESSEFDSLAQKIASITGSGQTGSDYAELGLTQDSGSYSFGQQSFFGSKIPIPSSKAGYTESFSSPQSESSKIDSSDEQVVSIGGSRTTSSEKSESDYVRSGKTQDSGSYNFGQQSFYGSKTPVSTPNSGYTKSSFSPQYESYKFDSVNQQVGSTGGSATAESQQTDNLDVGKK